MALSLYRKYRPNVFSDVVGQEHVERTLVNAVIEGTVAHAYLFCGPRGTGKTTTARLLAKALLCDKGPAAEPDGTCEQCQAIAEGTHPDVYELDAASRTGVENVREEIISRVQFAPTRGRSKVYIIDEVHMLSPAAFNALLKTLEEPPEHVVFILCTTDPHKVLATIQSRCQRFDFHRLSDEEIVGHLKYICEGEGYSYDMEALEDIASRSAGGMRDAITTLEQAGVYTQGNITAESMAGLFGRLGADGLFEFTELVSRCDTAGCFKWVDRLVLSGIDLSRFAQDLTAHVRNLYVAALTGGADGIISGSDQLIERYRQQSRDFGSAERLLNAFTVCGDLVRELRGSNDARLSVELACVRLCRPKSDLTLESLSERIGTLEAGSFAAASDGRVRGATLADGPGTSQQARPEDNVSRRQPEYEAKEELSAEDDAAVRQESQEQQQEQQQKQEPQQQEQQQEKAVAATMSSTRLLAAVHSAVKREDIATDALLSGVSLQHEDDTYYLTFPAGSEFSVKLISTGEKHDLVKRAFEEALGSPVQFECRVAAGYTAAADAESFPVRDAPRSFSEDKPPLYEEPIYESGDSGYDGQSFDDVRFDAPVNSGAHPVDEDTAADLADALSAFGSGIKFQELDGE